MVRFNALLHNVKNFRVMKQMKFEDEIKKSLIIRGFDSETLMNNRGLIGATIDEVILLTVKLSIIDPHNQEGIHCGYYYANQRSTAMECINCGRGKHQH